MDIDRKNTAIGEEAEAFLAKEYIKRREAMLNDEELAEQWEREEAERLAKIEYAEKQAQRSLDGFSAFPPRVLEDERLKPHHVDVLLGLLAYTETAQNGRVNITRPDLDTGHLSKFTRTSRSNLATYLYELKKWKYVMFELEGTWIYGIRWNMNTKGVAIALRRREDFVRVPNPVIHDVGLTSLQRHAYVTLCWLAYDLASRVSVDRKYMADTKPFFCTVSLLAKNMHASESTAKRALKQLAELHLIEYIDTPARDGRGNFIQQRDRDGNLMFDASGQPMWKMATLRGARPLLLVRPSVRYAKIVRKKKSGQRSPSFVVRPNFAMAYEAWSNGGDPGAMEVPEEC